jgi:membrane fusion protein (multidrug efflux system)
MRRVLALLCLFALALNPSCARRSGEAETLAGLKKREAARVQVEPVERREMVRRLETTTRVESEHHVEVAPRATGVVVELLVEEGDSVTEGSVLARLDDREARIALSQAEVALEEARDALPRLEIATREAASRMENARRTSEQAERDHERNLAISKPTEGRPALISPKDLDASRLARDTAVGELETVQLAHQRAQAEERAGQTAIDKAGLALDRARVDLGYTEIRSPVPGVVAERRTQVGDSVGSNTTVFVVSDPQKLRAVFHRPQRELALFRQPGTANGSEGAIAAIEVAVRAEALPGRLFRGRIERISPTIDAASGNFRVTARLDPSEPGGARLLPGMLVRLEIVTDRHPGALVVKKRAIRREADKGLIFVVESNVARRVEVEEGFGEGDSVEVIPLGGRALAEGDLVVVVGNRDLEDGAEVRFDAAPGPAPAAATSAPEPAGSGN